MRITSLKLENFQGIRSAEYLFNGSNADFYGDNATGKTTVFNAYTWLLFGKPSDGAANFTPKPREGDGDAHNVDTSVEMAFTHNQAEHTIARVFSEVWKKKRGNAEAEFSGHETAYFINGVPVRETDYAKFLAEIAAPEQFKILTFPLFFSGELDWAARRKILFDACGNLDDADVIASNPELADLPAMLGKNTIDEFKKIAAAAMKRTNEQLSDIPGRIDEATRAIPETSGTEEEIAAAIAALDEQKAALEQKRADIMTGGVTSIALRKAVSEKETQITEARSRHLRQNSEATEATYSKLADARTRSGKLETCVISAKRAVEKAEFELREMQAKRGSVKADYAAVQSEAFDENSTVCPTCGREYPAESIEQLKSSFNTRKSERLAAIIDAGKRAAGKDLIIAKEYEIETAKAALGAAIQQHDAAQAEVSALNDELAVKAGTLQGFEQTAEYGVLRGELDALRAQADDDKQAQARLVAGVDDEISVVADDIKRQYKLMAEHAAAAAQRARIKDLLAQEEKLGGEYVAQERQLYLCELFVKSKVAMLDERINGKFKTVRFRLFQEYINGGLKECCDVLIPTQAGNVVAWSGAANFAAKVNAGLEIIATLSEFWGVDVPVWFDGKESVSQLLPVPQQVITLSVREGEKSLKLERK
jgi:hypothetical protein